MFLLIGSRVRRLLYPLLPFFLLGAYAQQPVTLPGPTAVGTSAAKQLISLTLPGGGSLASIQVLTQGSPNLDFTLAQGGSCAALNYLPGQQCTVAVAFTPFAPGERRGAIVLLDSASHPLATRVVVASATGALATFIPGTISTVAGNTAWIYSGDGYPATQSSIFLPFGLAVDAAGDIFLADSSNNRIRRVDAVTGLISTVAGNGLVGSSGDGGPATSATLSGPSSVALDPAGNLYIADSSNNLIRRIDAFTGIIATVAGSRSLHGYSGDQGLATAAALNTPNGLALDPSGNLVFADTGNNVIRRVDAATGVITTVAGNGAAVFGGDNGLATAASLNNPWGVLLAPTGELYIADQNNNRVRMVSTAGMITTVAGTGLAGLSGDNGPATAASLNVPAGLALDAAGNLYIADSGNNRVRKVSGATGNITTIAGNGSLSFDGDNGPATISGLYGPYTLALDTQGSLFIADVFHNRIRKVAANAGTLIFPPMRVGRVSTPEIQTIENDGNAPLDPQSLTALSQSQIDAPNTTCVQGSPVAPSASCVLSVAFAPTMTGQLVSGQVNMLSDAANSPSLLTVEGQVLNTDPTTVTLTSSANPSATGTPVTFTVATASAGSTPTGDITLFDGSIVLGTATLNKQGSITFTVPNLSAGQHTLSAAYPGDSSNAAGESTPLVQTVQDPQAATVTVLTTSASPIDAGTALHLTATVSVATAGSGTGAIVGNVSFSDGARFLGLGAVSNGVATLTVSSLTVGTHALTAAYVGSSGYSASTSAVVTETVNLATTHLVVSSSASPSNAGAPLTLTATIVSSGGTPTGSITFLDGSASLGTGKLNAQGIATLVVPGNIWTPATHALSATYAGDPFDGSSSSQPVAQIVNLATSTLLLAASANPSPLGASISFTATATSNGGTPTGSVQFLDGGNAVGSATLNASGIATWSNSALSIGTHSITVSYAGDTYDSPGTSAPLIEMIQPTATSINISSSANPANYGSALSFSVTVNGTGAQPTGTVLLTDGGNALATLTLDANGYAVYTTSSMAIGSHSIVAAYQGDATHTATTSVTLNQRVVQTTTTTLTPAATHVIAGLQTTVTAVVIGANGKPVSGSIALKDGATTLTTLTPDQTGTAVYSTSALAPGTHALVASFAGDSVSGASSSSPSVQTVDSATTATTLASGANPAFTATPLTLSATVTGNGATPAGSVTFSDAGVALATVPLTQSGTASFTISTLTPGIHQLTASYLGDTNDSASLSSTLAQQIAAHSSVTISSSANPSLLMDNVTVTIVVANGTTAVPTGSVTLTDNGNAIGTPQLDATGHATITLTSPTLGTHTLGASYAGDSSDMPATSAAFVQTVTLRPTTTSFSSSSTNLSAGQQLIFVSVVQGAGAKTPTGTVTFESGAVTLGTVPVANGGIATLTLTAQQAMLNVVAVYSGDALFAPSTSAAVGIVVGPPIEFTLSTPGLLSMRTGQHGTLSINVATAATFNDTLQFGCAGLPADATCTFSTDQVAVGGGLPKTLSVTVDTGNPLGAGALAALLPVALLLSLRRRRLPLKLLAALVAAAMMAGLSGCASSFSQQSTPVGAYTFQIVATGKQTAATQAATVQLTVTQ
jgi:sugar lactone lactonase YvrE